MPDHFAQTSNPPPFQIDLSGLWNSLLQHLDVIGAAIWAGVSKNLPTIGSTVIGAINDALYGLCRHTAENRK